MSVDTQINFGTVVAGSSARPGAVNASYFYARWTGYLVPTVSGVYTIGVNAADGVNLFIGDTPLINQLSSGLVANSTLGYNASGKIELTAGVYYPLTLEWQHGTGTPHELQLIWTPPGGSIQLVPSANLSTSKASVTGNLSGSWWNGTSGLWYPSGPGIIDFANSNHANKNQDNVTDGATFKRLLYVNADNTFHVSTALNAQASILPNQVVLITYTMPSSSVLLGTWLAQTLARSDGSNLSVPASAGSTLLTNGDFESGTVGSQATGWTFNSGFALNTVNTNVHGGSKAGNINNTSGSTSSSLSPTFSLTAGAVYVMEGWIKTDALPNVPSHLGGMIRADSVSGISTWTIITKFGAFDASQPSLPAIGLPADGTARGYTFVQCFFSPNQSGTAHVVLFNQSNGGNVWFDDVKLYAHGGAAYTGLTATTGYYLYSYIDAITGAIKYANGAPPGTSPSDTLAQQCTLDGRIQLPMKKVTTPSSGGSGSDTGGGSGTCPEFDAPVYIRRYAENGVLVFEGEVRAGNVRGGWESDEPGPEGETTKRGDFLKGYSFKLQQDVFRAVQQFSHVPCAGWMKIDGIRFTACETVWDGQLDEGQWLPAYKVPGAEQDSSVGLKVLIQVEADWDDEHNYYVKVKLADGTSGARLIHNTVILPC